MEKIINTCEIGGAGRNEQDFLDFHCKHCHEILSEYENGRKTCKFLVAQESETANALYSTVKKQEKKLRELEALVHDDVPHQYQARILDKINEN